jgi:hypothetical protein
MQIGNKVVRALLMLQVDVLSNCAEVVAPMETASGLNAGKNAHSD